jgi:signal peptidase I
VSRGAKFGIGFAGAIGVLLVLWVVLNATDTLQQYRLPSESMEPTYDVGSRVMVGRDGFPFGGAGRGDVIVTYAPGGGTGPFDDVGDTCGAPQPPGASCARPAPNHSNVKFIKRIVAVGGDRVKILGGRAIVNGKALDEPYARLDDSCEACNLPREITVPPGHVFTLGDNRGNSVDSRTHGPTPEDWIVGKVLFKYSG